MAQKIRLSPVTNDYSQDGIPNISEFAFGLDPTQNNVGKLPQGQIIGGNFVLSFAQPATVSGILCSSVQQSPGLAPPSWSPVPDTGTFPQHTFLCPSGRAREPS